METGVGIYGKTCKLSFLHPPRAHDSITQSASWGNLMSIGLRNELRKPSDNATLATTYKWSTWYTNMVSAAQTVNSANPDILIFFSGLNFDTTLTPIVEGADLGNGVKFSKSDFPFENKIVLELHNYQNSASSCNSIQSSLYGSGFKALNESDPSAANVLPVVLTEWGHDQNDYEAVYASCLRTIIPEMNAGWMVWVLAGSYYIRTGTQDFDETWGMCPPLQFFYTFDIFFVGGLCDDADRSLHRSL